MSVATALYLEASLAPLMPLLSRPDATDLYINRPAEAWLERLGGASERHDVPDMDDGALWRLARQVASLSHQGISREHPILSATLPDGARVQIVAPPATRGPMALAIRRMAVSDLSLADYAAGDGFARVGAARGRDSAVNATLRRMLADGDVAGMLAAAVAARRSILVSGGTATGKTTFLNTLMRSIPATERLVLIEDTPELRLEHRNAVGLVAVRSALGEAAVTSGDLLEASLRMRPDRIILGELRGSEAFTFLRAVNTGHAGSMSTIHANNPEGAVEQLALLVSRDEGYRRADVIAYVRQVVDIIVQLAREDGRRFVSDICFVRDMAD